jgi:hypothetical protein
MALVSPGAQVSVINESFYTPAEPGTTPLIFVATKENKPNPAKTGIAQGTLAANAGKVYTISSQRELAETFGDPLFYTDASNNPIHGSEQNEYGLQAAYSFLGVSNRAYVVRTNIDLSAITPAASAPTGNPVPGAYWFDTNNSYYGIFEWNGATAASGGQKFVNVEPVVITDTAKVVDFAGENYTPDRSIGKPGSYAIVAVTDVNKLWYKTENSVWVEVGSAPWKNNKPVVKTQVDTPLPLNKTLTFVVVGETINEVFDIITRDTTLETLVIDINAMLNGTGISATSDSNDRLYLFNDGSMSDFFGIQGDADLLLDLELTKKNYYTQKLSIQPHTQIPEYKIDDVAPRPNGSIWIKTTNPNRGANWLVKKWNSGTEAWDTSAAPIYGTNQEAIYALDRNGGGLQIPEGTLYVQSNIAEDPASAKLATFKLFRRNSSGPTVIRSKRITGYSVGLYQFSIDESLVGDIDFPIPSTIITFESTNSLQDANIIAEAINAVNFENISAGVDSQNRIVITHSRGGEIRLSDVANSPLDGMFTAYSETDPASTTNLYTAPGADPAALNKKFVATLWKTLNYTASNAAPTEIPTDGTIWHSSITDQVDIMIHNGTTWVGYQNYNTAYGNTNPTGPIVSASQPTTQSDGSGLVDGDLWIDTADLENYPQIYKYNSTSSNWILVDKTDQTTENGIIFADARQGRSGGTATNAPSGSISDLLTSNYLDPDAPDPALYPKGMLLWNLRRSGFNVKRFVQNYVKLSGRNSRFNNQFTNNYFPHRWVTESENNVDGSGSFGRVAQRKVIVQSLQAMITSNDDIRDNEKRLFNLMACPGYPELMGEMISLNYDRGLTAFVVGDTPMRLQPNTTSINDWASNINQAVEDNDQGLVSRDDYLGVYYPAGYTSDNAGRNIVVPASHMALRTIALNDQVGYPWFAPAGTRRGGVTNATASGYINSQGEFVSVALNQGQRDTLYLNNVNPVTYINGAGLIVYGQKTRASTSSALDRVNVARLVIYLRSQLKTLSLPYIFEPNDKITRDEIKQQVESLMIELVGLRALYDYLVVCDETNNTPSRIDRNELYVDIAIEPVKAIEFIYIPLRLKNTGEIASLK